MSSFLIVKTSAIGDVVQAFPVLEYLRRKFPSSKIDWLVEKGCAPLIESHPMVDKVLVADTKKWKKNIFSRKTWEEVRAFQQESKATVYDAIFDLQGNIKSGFLYRGIQAKAKIGFGWKNVSEKPNLFFTSHRYEVDPSQNIRKQYLQIIQQYFNDTTGFEPSPVVLKNTNDEKTRLEGFLTNLPMDRRYRLMVAFGSKWPNKQLTEEQWLHFLKAIAKDFDPFFLFVYGGSEEKRVAEQFHACFSSSSLCVGGMSLPYWQSLMNAVDGVLAVDSAALHLCGTTSTPSFSVFGPSLSSVYKPFDSGHYSVQGECPYGKVFEKRCPVLRTCKSAGCMRGIGTDQLIKRFAMWFSENLKDRRSDQNRCDCPPLRQLH
jgi:heptosyltransferase I